jgi:hypothetical protein
MWIFNIFLFLCWWASAISPTAAMIYKDLVDSGSTCYYYQSVAGEAPTTAPPPCLYLGEGQ